MPCVLFRSLSRFRSLPDFFRILRFIRFSHYYHSFCESTAFSRFTRFTRFSRVSRIFPFVFVHLLFFSQTSVGFSANTYQLEPLVVETAKWQPATEFANSPANVLYGDDLKEKNPITLSDLLDGISGIAVPSLGGPGKVSSPVLNGFTGARVRVMIDGMPLNDPIFGTPDFSEIDPLSIDSIETVAGAGSGIWSSGGAGGLINITSRAFSENTLRFQFDGVGGNGQSLEFSDSFGDCRIGVSTGKFQTKAWSVADSRNGNTERDGFSRERLGLSLDGRISRKLKFSFRSSWQNSYAELDGFSFALGQPVDALNFTQNRDTSRWVLNFKRPVKGGEWTFYFGNIRTGLTGSDSDNPFNDYDFSTLIQKQAADFNRFETWGEWTAGFERQETTATNAGIYGLSETEGAFRAGIMAPITPGWRLRGILRMERPPLKSEKQLVTGRVAIVKEGKCGDVRLSWGRAFRSPSMNERFYPGYGDANLKSEDAQTWGLDLTRKIFGNKLEIGASIKDTTAYDLISSVTTADPAFPLGTKAGNVDEASVKSHSFSLKARISDRLSFTSEAEFFDKALNETTKLMLPRVPRQLCSSAIKYSGKDTVFALRHRHWGQQWDDTTNTKSLKATQRLDFDISGKLGSVNGIISVLNLADSHEQRILGYGEPGRRVAVSIEKLF